MIIFTYFLFFYIFSYHTYIQSLYLINNISHIKVILKINQIFIYIVKFTYNVFIPVFVIAQL